LKEKKSKTSIFLTNWKRKFSCYKYSFLEFLALKSKFFYNILMGWRKPVFLKEIKMSKVTENDFVLFIGAGILPSESILISEITNAKVVSIDNNKIACGHAKKYVKKRGISDKVIIKFADGIDFPLSKYNVIFIAINVWPIEGVLNNLSKNLKKGTRVMCKSYEEDIIKVLEKENLRDSFKLESKIQNPQTQSFLLIKK